MSRVLPVTGLDARDAAATLEPVFSAGSVRDPDIDASSSTGEL